MTGHPTNGSCGRRGQRTMFPDIAVAGAAQPERCIGRSNAEIVCSECCLGGGVLSILLVFLHT